MNPHPSSAARQIPSDSTDRWLRYLDHAATAAAQAPGVISAMTQVLSDGTLSPGRASHRLGVHASELLERARADVASFFGCTKPDRLIFTSGATASLNLATKGLLRPGDHVIVSCFEHTSVLRPLARLADRGVQTTIVRSPRPDDGFVEALARELRPHTRLVAVNHASNVFGWLLPVHQIAAAAHAAGAMVLLDAAQSVGHMPIDVRDLPVDLVAVGGHKGLLGPPGVGVLLVNNDEIDLVPTVDGGTGYVSEQLRPPNVMPVSYEAGTPNLPAIVALAAATRFLGQPDFIAGHKRAIAAWARAASALDTIDSVRIYGDSRMPSVPILSFTVRGLAPHRCAAILDQEFDIQVRAGLHCAPLAHDVAGTSPQGTVRASFGYGNDTTSADLLYAAVEKMTRRALL